MLVDTSVAVALVVADHTAHDAVIRALRGQRLGLAGHAFFETYSVLTRLPAPARRSAVDVGRLLDHNFPASRFLNATAARELAERLGELGISGGSVYDALVGAAASEYGLTLATRDERALDVYRALDVDFRVIG
jgi:predicted nucleic acid-binding protein